MLNRKSKVANLSPTIFAQEYIFSFDVEMEDFLGMNMLYTAANVYPYLVCRIFRQL